MPLGRADVPTKRACALHPMHPEATLRLDGTPPPHLSAPQTPLTLCYLCGPSVMSVLREQGYTSLRLTTYEHLARMADLDTQKQKARDSGANVLLEAYRRSHPLTTEGVPSCDLQQPGETHGLAYTLTTATAQDGSPFHIRLCSRCWEDTIETMRDEGYTNIRCTAPEQPAHLYKSHLTFRS